MTHFLILAALLLAGCSAPSPFVTGEQVPPPPGCIEYRTRGGQC